MMFQKRYRASSWYPASGSFSVGYAGSCSKDGLPMFGTSET